MRYRIGNRVKTRQKLSWQLAVWVISLAFISAGTAFLLLQLKNPKKAMAASCDSSYVLDWSDPTTYTVDCGIVNAANWTVKGIICHYYSPVFNVGGTPGDPAKEADVTVRINQSGNLDGNDTAWVYMYANDSIVGTYRCIGDSISAVFTTSLTIPVPAGGTYKIVVKLKNDKSNEMWQIKNGDVTSCLRTLGPLPISLGDFKAKTDADNKVKLKWCTFTEINNDFFTVERSAKGVAFESLARISGAGNSNSLRNYSFTDESPNPGINFYRLRQTDYDGTSVLSSVITATVEKGTGTKNIIRIFPNPFTYKFTLEYESDADQQIIIRLVSMDGHVLFSEKHQSETGTNIISCAPFSQIRSGNYLVQLVKDEKVIGTVKAICK